MRILLLNQFYPPDTAPTGQLLADVADGLVGDGHEVHVICSAGSYHGGALGSRGRDRTNVIRVHRVGATARGRVRTLDRLLDWGSYYVLAGKRALQLGRFDTCLALTTPPFIGVVGLLIKRLRGTRLVLWSMDMWPDVAEALGSIRPAGVVSCALRGVAAALYSGADQVISLGRTMSQRLAAHGLPAHKITIVHNWVPAEAVRPLPRGGRQFPELRSLNGSFVVMYSGNMGMAHEFETILDAAALLREDRAVQFVFAGGGKRRAEVEAGVALRGLQNVTFLQSRPLSELAQLLSTADAHLISMREEVLGTLVPSKIYGILAAGRPALFVGPPRCEVADLIQASGAGASFRAGEGPRLASVIRGLAANQAEARRLGQAGRSHYERFLGRDRSVASVIAAVTGSKGPRSFEPGVPALQQPGSLSGRTRAPLPSELPAQKRGHY